MGRVVVRCQVRSRRAAPEGAGRTRPRRGRQLRARMRLLDIRRAAPTAKGPRWDCGRAHDFVVAGPCHEAMNERERRIARARLLRRAGKTYNEIREVIGPVGDDALQAWLRGIPRPPETLRTRAKDELRRECRRLRGAGCTYDEIAAKTGASKGSISPWVRDITMPSQVSQERLQRNSAVRKRIGARHRDRAAARREERRREAASGFGVLAPRDLFVAGVALYWAEGTKDKAWRRNGCVVLINSDASVLALFLRWLDLIGVPEEDRGYRLNIHESADVRANEAWWAERLQLPLSSFSRATLKRHNPKTVRQNCGADYHGCLVVRVARSGWLYYAIEGWWQAMSGGFKDSTTNLGNVPLPLERSRVVQGQDS